jgi:hypothetical protein
MGLIGWITLTRLMRMEAKRVFVALLFLLFVFYGCLDLGTIYRQFSLSGGILYHGLPITIEYEKGTVRSGVDREGNPWQQEMFHHYGYFEGIMGADGKELDVYYNPDGKSDKIFRVIQLNTLTKEFDEYKIMLGFDTIEDAKQGYLVHYPEGWVGFGGIEEITLEHIKREEVLDELVKQAQDLEMGY